MDDRNHSRMGFIRSLEESIICPLVKWRANNDVIRLLSLDGKGVNIYLLNLICRIKW